MILIVFSNKNEIVLQKKKKDQLCSKCHSKSQSPLTTEWGNPNIKDVFVLRELLKHNTPTKLRTVYNQRGMERLRELK